MALLEQRLVSLIKKAKPLKISLFKKEIKLTLKGF